MNKKDTIRNKLKKARAKYSYVEIARKFDTTDEYVYLIATGRRVPVRGKGLEIKKELEKLVKG
ncbi:XRE family transcriptional regulator [Riemerella anatipestifer]|uniref:XRE family transcriptional regulator n=1 Tax=Riemerella anatipestifer TaxID=34085 RepID=UPI00129D9853|nr:XRE family transcriptional regulator [Riemerella anatipestifer]MRM84544.1 XRE family transcriptional regulator [Riemerella anatipestifer]WPC10771.1 XRE family transcriptional regulator [Riemerella anatipestifer]WPC13578.1 XRE family transcriptional regulator [Riemerella anatipestifer]